MLSGTGNALFKEMRMELGPRKTFSAICTAATLDREEAHTYFREEWNLPDKEADRFAGMLYPEDECETYLVLTTGMMMRLGLIEYYAEWDFTGDQPLPVSTTYYSYPNGFGQIDMENETADPFVKRRKLETIWQLFFDRDGIYEDQVMFERVYEAVDGIEQVQVWRIVP